MAPTGAWTIEGEPYSTAPGSKFRWFRSRIVGGRTNHWGRIRARFAPVDFKSKTHDGLGDDWPFSYEDLAPYYDRVESYIGVFGTKENIPSAPDGIFQPPPKPRCSEVVLQRACQKAAFCAFQPAWAVLTRPLIWTPCLPLCGQCGRGCRVAAQLQFESGPDSSRPENGTLTLITGAMAARFSSPRRPGAGRFLHREGHALR